MLEIAQQSGLVQSSLYYYFRRKESIVAELLQQINRVPLAYAKQLRKEGDEPDVQLFRLVRFDVRNVCQFPLEITEVRVAAGVFAVGFLLFTILLKVSVPIILADSRDEPSTAVGRVPDFRQSRADPVVPT